MPPCRVNPSGPPASGSEGHFDNSVSALIRKVGFCPQSKTDDMAEAIAAGPGAPIKARVHTGCVLHRQRWRSRPWQLDLDELTRTFARRQAKMAAPAAIYAEAAR